MTRLPLLPVLALLAAPLVAQRQALRPLETLRVDASRRLHELRTDAGGIERLATRSTFELPGLDLPDGSRVDLVLRRLDLTALRLGFEVDGTPAPGLLAGLGLSVWRGEVAGDPGSDVLLSFSHVGTRGWIRTRGTTFHLLPQPDTARGWSAGRVLLLDSEALGALGVDLGMTCGADGIPGNALEPDAIPRGPEPGRDDPASTLRSPATTLYTCGVAVETDWQLNQVFGGDLSAETAYVTTLLAAASDRYLEQLDTRLTFPYVQFYTSPADPWSTPETAGAGTGDMLGEFRSAWGGAPLPGGANLGHFLSGAGLGGGVAYLSVLCDTNHDFSFGVSANLAGAVPFPVQQGPLNWDFVVFTHEIGHNFSTPHTHDYCPPIDQCAPDDYNGQNLQGACQTATVCTGSGTIMSYCHLCPGGIGNITTFFHPLVVDRIGPHVQGCLPPAAGVTVVAPEFLAPGTTTPVTANLIGTAVGPVELHHRADAGSAFSQVVMSPASGGSFVADLPPYACGQAPEFFVRFTEIAFGVIDSEVCVGEVTVQTVLFSDDFQADQGWTVGAAGDTAVTGVWERVDPNGTSAQPSEGVADGGGPVCFVTGQGTPGGSLGENDVDAGQTTLVSPPIDLSTGDAEIGYWRWYSNSTGSAPGEDVFVVEVSGDGTTWVQVESVGPTGSEANGGWIRHDFRVSDFVTPGAQVRVRFVASDFGNGSVVEAAVDAFEVYRLECLTCQPDLGFGGPGSVVLSVCGDALVPGGQAELKLTGAPSFAPAVVFYSTNFQPTNLLGGTFVPLPIQGSLARTTDLIGEVTVPIAGGLASGSFFVQAAVADGGNVLFSNAIRMDFL